MDYPIMIYQIIMKIKIKKKRNFQIIHKIINKNIKKKYHNKLVNNNCKLINNQILKKIKFQGIHHKED